jgi:hypothetical protein
LAKQHVQIAHHASVHFTASFNGRLKGIDSHTHDRAGNERTNLDQWYLLRTLFRAAQHRDHSSGSLIADRCDFHGIAFTG